MRTFTNKKAVPVKQTAKQKLQYVRKNWQLYLFFLMPALLLTIIFKYIPMSGVLIAFEDYNVIDGVFGSEWVGLEYFQRFLSSPDFMNYLMNTLKLSAYGLLWGFPVPIILALLLNRIRKAGIRKKIQLLIYAPNFISGIVSYNLYRQRNLADSRMGIDHVYCSAVKCEQRSGRGSNCRWCKYFTADLVCRTSGNQKYYCHPVYFAGRKYYEHWI